MRHKHKWQFAEFEVTIGKMFDGPALQRTGKLVFVCECGALRRKKEKTK